MLILAAHPSSDEATKLSPPLTPEQAFALHEAFLRDLVELSMDSPIAARFLCYWPPDSRDWFNANFAGIDLVQQRGDGPGERLSHAFEQILTIGYTPVIAVRADYPDLPPDVITEAIGLLASCDLVLGPSTHGDYYLLALNEPAPELFRRVDWSKPGSRCKQVLAHARKLGMAASVMDEWHVVHDARGLQTLRESNTLRTYSKAALAETGG